MHTHSLHRPTCHFNCVACKSELKVVHGVNLSINNSSKHSNTSKVNLTQYPQGHTQFPPTLIHTYSNEDLTMHGNIRSSLLNSSSELIFLAEEEPVSMHTKTGIQAFMHVMYMKAQIRGKCSYSNTHLVNVNIS